MKFFNVFTSFFTGAAKECYLANLNGRKFNSLYSYWYLRDNTEEQIIEGFKTNTGEIFIDSGAFTAYADAKMKRQKEDNNKRKSQIDINQYIEDYIVWINKWDQYVTAFGQMDIIPVEAHTKQEFDDCCQRTWQNYLYMTERINCPKKLLYTFHFGEPYNWLEQALEYRFPDGSQMEYMALGGLVGKSTKERVEFLDKCFQIITKSSNPNIKVHGFGVSSEKLWRKYPFYSCDSYTPGFNATYGYSFNEFGAYREPDYKKVFKPKKPDNKNALFKTLEVKEYETYEENEKNLTEDEKQEILRNRQMERSKLLTNNIEHWTNLAESIQVTDYQNIKRIF